MSEAHGKSVGEFSTLIVSRTTSASLDMEDESGGEKTSLWKRTAHFLLGFLLGVAIVAVLPRWTRSSTHRPEAVASRSTGRLYAEPGYLPPPPTPEPPFLPTIRPAFWHPLLRVGERDQRHDPRLGSGQAKLTDTYRTSLTNVTCWLTLPLQKLEAAQVMNNVTTAWTHICNDFIFFSGEPHPSVNTTVLHVPEQKGMDALMAKALDYLSHNYGGSGRGFLHVSARPCQEVVLIVVTSFPGNHTSAPYRRFVRENLCGFIGKLRALQDCSAVLLSV